MIPLDIFYVTFNFVTLIKNLETDDTEAIHVGGVKGTSALLPMVAVQCF